MLFQTGWAKIEKDSDIQQKVSVCRSPVLGKLQETMGEQFPTQPTGCEQKMDPLFHKFTLF